MSASEFYNGETALNGIAFDISDNLYIGKTDGIFKFDNLTGGSIRFVPSGFISGHIQNMVFGRAGFPLHVITSTSKYYKIDPSGNRLIVRDDIINPFMGMIMDKNDDLYYTSTNNGTNNNVIKITSTGIHATFITNSTNLNWPVGLAVDISNNLYVSNQKSNKIFKYSLPDGNLITESFITLKSSSGGSLIIDKNNNIYVSYHNGSMNFIEKYQIIGNTVSSLIYSFSTTLSDQIIIGFAINSLGDLYFGNMAGRKIMKYTPATPTTTTTPTTTSVPCFKEDTQILTIDGYKSIQNLRNGDLIKTFEHDYKPIVMIGKRDIYHPVLNERIKNQLYQCSQSEYPEIFKPLILTGCHSLLVDDFISEEQREKVIEINGDTFVTENKYRLPACVDHRATVYETAGTYTIYHLALENDNYYFNYGIYANGLLVETCSQRYLKELSEMTLIE
jgi:hypothetical protein